MSARHKRSRWLAMLAGIAIAIPLAMWAAVDRQDNSSQIATPDAAEERRLKTAAVDHDTNATAELCTMECAQEFRKLAQERPTSDEVRHLLAMHPHMAYIRLDVSGAGGKPQNFGSIPQGTADKARQLFAEARSKATSSTPYVSEPFRRNGHRYIVMGVKSADGSLISGIIRQDIVDEVAKHQKRNLRLVPYPAEGDYRIESAEPNTTRDVTVRTGEGNQNASHYHVHEVVVRFKQEPGEQELKQIMQAIDGKSARKLGYTHIFTSRTMEAEQLMNYFRDKWNPLYVEPHYLYLTNTRTGETSSRDISPIIPNDALYYQYQWNLPVIETEKGWQLSKGNEQVTVAVLDTGVQLDHPDLTGKLEEGLNIVSETPPEDDVGHGTHVAGVIAANVNNSEGVAGMTWNNKVMPVKVLDSSGSGTTYSVAEGIIWATDHGAKVINMSLGNYASAQFLHDAIRYAYDHDVVLVAASGNDNTERPGYPAAYPEVFAVAATDSSGRKASFSNYGDYIDAAAPGATIPSTYPGNQYAALSGTSMACPHVAALAALIRSVNPTLSNEEVMQVMRETATDLGEEGKDIYYGYGQIDVVRALQAADDTGLSLENYSSRLANRVSSLRSEFGINR
ncbi:S8 family peptidase [Paenibacillus tarimensis]|uniref:S8 family peptidase n=1 Tax=Paenibacillus tarimensis TaxID=416012 RepID=UPI001F2081DB|nr:S8 family peptidase [Paenibacillus tarimensis]MCF2942080.1 S8 family peptidase [Paenibacillus tarimensis]